MCILLSIIDIYKIRDEKATKRSVRYDRITYRKKLDYPGKVKFYIDIFFHLHSPIQKT